MLKIDVMKFRNSHIFHTLFLACFAFYVISPFCYIGKNIEENSISAYSTQQNSSRIGVVWELFFGTGAQQNSKEGSQSNVHFLIKKARAVLNSNNPEKIPLHESALCITVDHISLDGYSDHPVQLTPHFPDDVHPLSFSGLSPPALIFS